MSDYELIDYTKLIIFTILIFAIIGSIVAIVDALTMHLIILRPVSSIGQSTRLIIERFGVRTPDGPPFRGVIELSREARYRDRGTDS